VLDASGATVSGQVRTGGLGLSVPVCTLPDVLRKHGFERVDVLKIDCEGSEYDVIEGAVEVLHKVARITGEFHRVEHHKPADLKQTLEHAGFQVMLRREANGLGTFTAMRP
jgi:hypothetical protein